MVLQKFAKCYRIFVIQSACVQKLKVLRLVTLFRLVNRRYAKVSNCHGNIRSAILNGATMYTIAW